MFFLRVDYVVQGSGVQRIRSLERSLFNCYRVIKSIACDHPILQVKIELCA